MPILAKVHRATEAQTCSHVAEVLSRTQQQVLQRPAIGHASTLDLHSEFLTVAAKQVPSGSYANTVSVGVTQVSSLSPPNADQQVAPARRQSEDLKS